MHLSSENGKSSADDDDIAVLAFLSPPELCRVLVLGGPATATKPEHPVVHYVTGTSASICIKVQVLAQRTRPAEEH